MSVTDRLLLTLTAIVRHLTSELDYAREYGATVVSQNADLTLELRPDVAKLKVPGRVPIIGLPGVKVKVARGARCLIGFEDGNPQKPRARLFTADSLLEIDVGDATALVKLAGGGAPIARLGDVVQVVLPLMVAGPYPVTLVPGGYAGVMPVPIVAAGQVLTGSEKASSG